MAFANSFAAIRVCLGLLGGRTLSKVTASSMNSINSHASKVDLFFCDPNASGVGVGTPLVFKWLRMSHSFLAVLFPNLHFNLSLKVEKTKCLTSIRL